MTQRNTTREIVEEIDSQDRSPVRCADCNEIADGLKIIQELVEDDSVRDPWACPSCREKRGEDR